MQFLSLKVSFSNICVLAPVLVAGALIAMLLNQQLLNIDCTGINFKIVFML